MEYSRHSAGVSIPAINWPITDRQGPERRGLISDQARRHNRRPCWTAHHFQAAASNRTSRFVWDPCYGIFQDLRRRAARGEVTFPCSPGGVRTDARIEGTAYARGEVVRWCLGNQRPRAAKGGAGGDSEAPGKPGLNQRVSVCHPKRGQKKRRLPGHEGHRKHLIPQQDRV